MFVYLSVLMKDVIILFVGDRGH